MSDIRLDVLGPLRVAIGGDDVPVAGAKQRSLLAVLAAGRGPVTRDVLVDALWSERRPADPGHALENQVSRLRGLLGAASRPVRRSGDGYELALDVVELDTERFEDLVEQARRARAEGRDADAFELLGAAEASWRGRPFADVPDVVLLATEAARLEQLRRTAHDLRFDAALALGRHRDVVAELRHHVSQHPLDERRRGQLMAALAGSGRQAEALTVFEEGRRHLRDDLGVEPGAELRALHVRLLRGEPDDDGVPSPRAAEVPAPLAVAARSPMLGREREAAVLDSRWDRARDGDGGLVLLEGEPGAGKTRLLAHLAGRFLPGGADVLFGRCDDRLHVPYQPFVEALGALPGADGPVSEDVSRHRMFDGVLRRLATRCGEAPVLLLVDDLHWATAPTLLLLRHLVRWGGDLPLLLVATVRDRGHRPDDAEATLLSELRAEPAVDRLVIERLSLDAVRELVLAQGGDPAEAAVVHDRTGGNAFLVRELLRETAATDAGQRTGADRGVPDRVDALVRSRRQRLSAAADGFLEAAAVVGPSFDVDVAGPAAELEEVAVPGVLDELVAAGFLDERDDATGRRYAFGHALVRDAVLGGTNPVRRRLLHRAVVTTLGSVGSPDLDELAATLADHSFEAESWSDAVRYAALAAEVATRRYAWEDAAQHHRRALSVLGPAGEEDRRPELLLALADAERRSANTAEALTVYREAYEECRGHGSPRQLARAAVGFEDARAEESFEDHAAASRTMLQGALDAVAGVDAGLEAAVLARLVIAEVHRAGRTPSVADLADRAIAAARSRGEAALLGAALEAAYWADWTTDGLTRRLGLAEELLALVEGRDDRRVLRARVLLASARLEAADRDGFERALAGYASEADRISEPWYQWWVRAFDGTRAILDGRLDELTAVITELGPRAGGRQPAETVGLFATVLAFERGRRDGYGPLIEGWTRVLRSESGNLSHTHAGLALLTALHGDHGRARQHLAEASIPSLAAWPSGAWGIALLGLAAAETGDRGTAEEVAEVLGPYPGRVVVMGALTPVTTTSFVLARVADVLGDVPEALRLLGEATDLHRSLGAETWATRSMFHRAELLSRPGPWQDGDEACQVAGEVGRSAGRLGMEELRVAAGGLREHPTTT